MSAPQQLMFQALADPSRLAIFEHLSRGEASVNALVARFPISQPAVSQHLAVLTRCQLVARRREGRHSFYKARPEGLDPLTDWLTQYRTLWPERLARLQALLTTQATEGGATPRGVQSRS